MTLSSKRELIQAIRKIHRKSSRAQKGSHLDHLELATGLQRIEVGIRKTPQINPFSTSLGAEIAPPFHVMRRSYSCRKA